MQSNVCKAMNIKSNYILKNLFKMISKSLYLDLINYNKALQSRMEIDINDYKNIGKKFKIGEKNGPNPQSPFSIKYIKIEIYIYKK